MGDERKKIRKALGIEGARRREKMEREIEWISRTAGPVVVRDTMVGNRAVVDVEGQTEEQDRLLRARRAAEKLTRDNVVIELFKEPGTARFVDDFELLKYSFEQFEKEIREQRRGIDDIEYIQPVMYEIDYRMRQLSERWELGRLIIKDKESGRLSRFVMNALQEELYGIISTARMNGFPIRLMILKARQWGGSTLSEALIYVWSRKCLGTNALIVAHQEKAAKNLFSMYRRFYNNDLCSRAARITQDEIQYVDAAEGLIHVASGYNKDEARSYTTHWLHLSEVVFYRTQEALGALTETVPYVTDSAIIIETTPWGRDFFYDMWGDHNNKYIKFFAPWWKHAEYQMAFRSGEELEAFMDALSDKERELGTRFNLSMEQLNWRRCKIWSPGFRGDEQAFNSEYPTDDESCFAQSGRLYFAAGLEEQKIRQSAKWKNQKIQRYHIDHNGSTASEKFLNRSYGEFSIYEHPIRQTKYVIGVDVAEGKDASDTKSSKILADSSVIEVIKEKDGVIEQVAEMVTQCHIDVLSRHLNEIGRYYNNAWIAPERNGNGLALIMLLREVYPWVFKMPENYLLEEALQQVLEVNHQVGTKYGWQTSKVTRPIMLTELNYRVRFFDGFIVNSSYWLSEADNFVIWADGTPRAKKGRHDDSIMAMAIAIQCALHTPKGANKTIIDKIDDGEGFLDMVRGMTAGETKNGVVVMGEPERDSYGFLVKK